MIPVCSAPNAYETSETWSKPTTRTSISADSAMKKNVFIGEYYCHLTWRNKHS